MQLRQTISLMSAPWKSLRFLVLLLLLLVAHPSKAANGGAVIIGVLAYRGDNAAMARWSATADYLNRHVPGHVFRLRPLGLASIESAVASNELDFVLTNPGNYTVLEARYGTTRMVTMQALSGGKNFTRFGSVVIARSDRDDLQQLDDLRDKHVMAVDENAFGGYQMALRELKKLEIDPAKDLASLRFGGFPMDNVVFAVINGDVDVGIVRTGVMEQMIGEGTLQPGQVKVLGARQSEGFSAAHSTRLYPEWPFAKLKSTPEQLAKQVAQSLLAIPADSLAARSAHIIGWTIPLDYTPVHELMKELRISPYEKHGQVTWQDVQREYWPYLAAVLIVLLSFVTATAVVVRTNRRLSHSEALLKESREFLEQKVAVRTRELQHVNDRLEKDIRLREEAEAALVRSRNVLQSLYEIAVDYSRTHEEKLLSLIALVRKHYNKKAGLLFEIGEGGLALCMSSGETEHADDIAQCLSGLSILGSPVEVPPEHSRCNERGLLAIPVVVHGHACCVLAFIGSIEGHQDLEQVDRELLMLMARWVGAEMEHNEAISEKEQHRTRLMRMARLNAVGYMASELAHELNQPLTAAQNYIGGGLRMLDQGHVDTDVFMDGMRRAQEGVNRATEVIRHLRQMVQTGAPIRNWFDYDVAIDHILDLLRNSARKAGVTMVNMCPESNVRLWGDMLQIEQVLLNLVRNAIDATPAGGEVRIGMERRDGQVRVCVRDQGAGISTDQDESVFDPFYTTKEDGMGLGLSICRAIIEAHDGRIMADNGDIGARFCFELPEKDVSCND